MSASPKSCGWTQILKSGLRYGLEPLPEKISLHMAFLCLNQGVYGEARCKARLHPLWCCASHSELKTNQGNQGYSRPRLKTGGKQELTHVPGEKWEACLLSDCSRGRPRFSLTSCCSVAQPTRSFKVAILLRPNKPSYVCGYNRINDSIVCKTSRSCSWH